MTSIAIDVGIADTLRAVNEILAHHGCERATVWESLGEQLQAVLLVVGDLDRMYFVLLTEIENIFENPEPSPERITVVIDQGRKYCADETLTMNLVEWRGAIQVAALTALCGIAGIATWIRHY